MRDKVILTMLLFVIPVTCFIASFVMLFDMVSTIDKLAEAF